MQKRFYALIGLAAVLPVAFFAAVAWSTYRDALADGRNRLERTARVAVEHANRVIETNAVIAQSLLLGLAHQQAGSPEARGRELHEMVRGLGERLPQIQSIWIWDAEGRPVVSSLFHPPPAGLNVRDRRYFQVHERDGAQWYVSQPLRSRTTGELFFDVTRRWERNGRFAGVISVSLRPEYFSDYYRELSQSELGAAIALVRGDGAVIARWPQPPQDETWLKPDSPMLLRFHEGEPAGFVHASSSVDGLDRMAAFARTADYPLFVSVAIEPAALLANWRTEVATLAAITFPATAALVWLLVLVLRRAEREAEAHRRLREEAEHRAQAEAALRHAQKLEALGLLTGGVAHDFNNLLMVLSNNVYLLRRQLDGHPDIAGALAAMGRAIEAGTKLTRQLLTFARRQPVVPVVVQPAEVVRGMRELLQTVVPHGVSLELRLNEDAPAVRVDPAEFELALINVVVNARDALQGQGTIRVQVERVRGAGAGLEDRDYAAVRIADTGCGIAPEHLEKVFEPFFTTKPHGVGTGLGLSHVYGFCTQAGGTVRIDSALGRGTTVSMVLPATDAPRHAAPTVRGAPQRLTGRVLLVEDNREIASTTEHLLQSFGCQVMSVASADEALVALEQDRRRVDAVLSDIMMPGARSGLELARIARSRWPDLPVLLMTGYAAELQASVNDGVSGVAQAGGPGGSRACAGGAPALRSGRRR